MHDALPHTDLSSLYLPTHGDRSIASSLIAALTEAVSDDGFSAAHYRKLRELSFAIETKFQDMEACDD